MLAQPLITGVVLIWTYLGNRFWTFSGAKTSWACGQRIRARRDSLRAARERRRSCLPETPWHDFPFATRHEIGQIA
eukprot:gene20173-20727_t